MALRLEREEWDILEAEIHTSCTAQGLKEHLITWMKFQCYILLHFQCSDL